VTTDPSQLERESLGGSAAAGAASSGDAVLSVRDLGKRYGSRWALRGIDLEVEPGEMVACIGPNGAGKTTLLSILAGVLAPDSGKVNRGREEIGWVPQQTAVYGKLSVEENLRLFARLERVPDTDGTVARMLELTDLADRRGDVVSSLSGGNRQRINIAIGLLAGPPVLLLDEPGGALDPRQRQILWTLVEELAQGGTTVVYATHHVQEVERYAQRVVVLADGESLFVGTPAQLWQEVADDAAAAGRDHPEFEAAFVAFLRKQGH
jgi:ABC-2 type transport system ATP-binding protein